MLYQLKYGKTEEAQIEAALMLGREIPQHIANAPELFLGLELYYDAFWDLSSSRPSGFGPGQIPYREIWEYATLRGFSEEQRDDLLFFIPRMDEEFLKYHQSRLENEQAARKPPKRKR